MGERYAMQIWSKESWTNCINFRPRWVQSSEYFQRQKGTLHKDKGINFQDILILNLYALNKRASKYMRQKLTKLIEVEIRGLPRRRWCKESTSQCRRHKRRRFDPWAGMNPWRRAWDPTSVFLPGESHGQRILAGCSPWGRKELAMTAWLTLHFHFLLHVPHHMVDPCL